MTALGCRASLRIPGLDGGAGSRRWGGSPRSPAAPSATSTSAPAAVSRVRGAARCGPSRPSWRPCTVGGLQHVRPRRPAPTALPSPGWCRHHLLGPVDMQDIVAAPERPRGREVRSLHSQAGEMGVEQPGVGIPRAVAPAGPGQHPQESANLCRAPPASTRRSARAITGDPSRPVSPTDPASPSAARASPAEPASR